MDFGKIIAPISWSTLPPEFMTSLLAFLISLILILIINIKVRNYDPLRKPSGFMNVCEIVINFADKQVQEIMGPAFSNFGGYISFLGFYILIGFIIGMIGIPNVFQPGSEAFLQALPNPFTNIAFPLSIAICTFVLTHFTAIKYKKWSYFKRYIEPIPLFLPINLITMWSSTLSLTLRLFGNALAGYCVITLIYVGLGTAIPPEGSFFGFFLEPLIAPIAHLYFDIFDGCIQLAVFCILTMIYISNEYVSLEEMEEEKALKLEIKKRKEEKRLLKSQKRSLKEKKIWILLD